MVKTSETVVRGAGGCHSVEQRDLADALQGVVRDLGCDFEENGTLILSGQAICFYHKQLAQEAARRVAHPSRIINRIDVIPGKR